MTARHPTLPADLAASRQYFPILLLLFVGSGCAALIYEIVWFQMLSLIVGSSAISLGVLLGTFMGGMCLGSLLLSKYIPTGEHPLRVYAKLEVGIAVSGVLILLVLPLVASVYAFAGGPGFFGLLVRGLVCAICLLPPTMMMGATLPAIARWVETTPAGISWLGFFYGGNIAGAVLGSLLAGFYLLRVHDTFFATFTAVGLNLAVAGIGFGMAKVTGHTPAVEDPSSSHTGLAPTSWPVLVAIGISGATALGAEVIWTRLLSLTLGGTVYTFSLILAAILMGLGIGSALGAVVARSVSNPRMALGWCQLMVMAGLSWAAYALTQDLPYWPIYPSLAPRTLFNFQLDLVRCLWTVLPASVLWGASFPIALAAVVEPGQDPGKLVGKVYAANTVGGILGAIVASLIIIAWLGTQNGTRLLIGLAGVSSILLLAPSVDTVTRTLRLGSQSVLRAVLAAGLGVWLASTVIPVPGLLVAYGRWMASRLDNHGEIIYTGEGMNSSMAVSRLSNGVLNYHNAGKVQASSEPQDMRLQRMLGHLTTLVPAHPKRVLVIGCGAGVTAGAVSISPAVESVTIAEIEPLVPKVVSRFFSEHNYSVVDNPKVHVQIDDARHFLLTSKEKFDAITSDPFDPWVKGAATLYTKEFFEIAKKHLNPGGIVTVFVQLYESTEAAVKSEVATFLEAFPNGMVFGNTHMGGGYDVVLLGQTEPTKINVDEIQARLNSPEYAQVAKSLSEIGFNSAVDLFSTFAGQGEQLKGWLADAQVNRDRNLRLQYLAGLGVNLYEQASIYANMLVGRHYPDNLFVGSPATLETLRTGILTTR